MLKPLRRSIRHAFSDLQSRYLHDWIFIHINKTGGSSIEQALGMQFDHRSARDKIMAIGRAAWDRKFSFSVVRNPWDKVVSHYHYRLKTAQSGFRENPPDFASWVHLAYAERDPRYFDQPLMFAPQMDWIGDEQDRILVNFVGRFERLQEDFAQICQHIGRQASLPHLKASQHAHYSQYYDAESRATVAQHFSRDIEHLGYAFESPPDSCAAKPR